MTGGKVWEAVKRRCKEAGLPSSISNHSFRATGITIHQENKGRLGDAQALAGHADARTTRPYIRAERKIAQAEVERVQL
jgi:integrase